MPDCISLASVWKVIKWTQNFLPEVNMNIGSKKIQPSTRGNESPQQNVNGDRNVTNIDASVTSNTTHIIAPEPKRLPRNNSPLKEIPRFLKDLETEKSDVCLKCGVTVHLSFCEPIEMSGSLEVKSTTCPSCKTPILELRKFTTEQNRLFFGKLDIKKIYGPWRKILIPEN